MANLVLGYGKLGKEIVQQTGWDYISRTKDNFDFCKLESFEHYLRPFDQILNCIAFTQTYSEDREANWNTNYQAVANLCDYCRGTDKKIIHISSDFVYKGSKSKAKEEDLPIPCETWYGLTKLLADSYIQIRNNNYLIIRTSFKDRPFPWNYAIQQQGNFLYTDEISNLIIQLVEKKAQGIFNVGRKESWSMYDMAKQTNKDVGVLSINPNILMPDDITMDVSKMTNYLRKDNKFYV